MPQRCKWVNLDNPLYVKYHDEEWGRPVHDDKVLYEFLILEMFQAGLSWETILRKRENFRKAFDNFDVNKVATYNNQKKLILLNTVGIVRNKNKIVSAVNNSKLFIEIQKEYGSFNNYIWGFTNNQIIYENDKTTSELSDKISKDLNDRGFKFVGSTIIYSYLQAIGVINSHDEDCFLYHKN